MTERPNDAGACFGAAERLARGLWLVHALLYVGAIRLALQYLPLGTTRALLRRLGRFRLRRDPRSIPRAVAALQTASGWIPGGGNCFVRAWALQTLLAHRGIVTDLHVGFVAVGTGAGKEGHAWLEHEGRILVGRVDGIAEFRGYNTLF